MIQLAEILQEFRPQFSLYALVFARIGAASALLPAFGEQSIPMRVKLVIAIAFTAIVAPMIPAAGNTDRPMSVTPSLLITESLIGTFFGLMIRLILLALQTAGSIAAQASSLSQIFGGAGVDPLPAIGHVLVIAGLALAVLSGLHVQVSVSLAQTYEALPIGAVLGPADTTNWGVSQISNAMSLAFVLSAPFVIASLIYNLALGVISKAMPQLMVAMVGAPAITGGTIALLALISPFLLEVWLISLTSALQDPMGFR